MIFIDSNIFMYAAGSDHPNKAPSARLVKAIAAGKIAAVVSTEVLQEILHRYRAIRRWEAGRHVYDEVRKLLDVVLPVTVDHLDQARALLDIYDGLSARDALHAAVCFHTEIDTICSYDSDFDTVANLTRHTPDVVIEGIETA